MFFSTIRSRLGHLIWRFVVFASPLSEVGSINLHLSYVKPAVKLIWVYFHISSIYSTTKAGCDWYYVNYISITDRRYYCGTIPCYDLQYNIIQFVLAAIYAIPYKNLDNSKNVAQVDLSQGKIYLTCICSKSSSPVAICITIDCFPCKAQIEITNLRSHTKKGLVWNCDSDPNTCTSAMLSQLFVTLDCIFTHCPSTPLPKLHELRYLSHLHRWKFQEH